MLTNELLHFIQTEKNISMEFVEKARERGKGVYLYGAGNQLHFAVKFMRRYDIKIIAILDTYRQGKYEDIPIILFSDFLESVPDKDSWFVISAPSVHKIIAETISQYFHKENIFRFEIALYVDFLPSLDQYRHYLMKHWDTLIELFDSLADETSKYTLVSVIKGRITGDLSYFRQCYTPEQYYVPGIIEFSNNEIMVELGANNGETLLEFMKLCPNFKSAYCFEPGKECLSTLAEIANSDKNKRIHIISKGAWDCQTMLGFSVENEVTDASHILLDKNEKISYRIETTTVDDEIDEPISYMKMDIEGAELRALYGARNQITKNRPQLAICVYHRVEDILSIWDYLRKLVPDYRFYIRHHLPCSGTDTVLYAVTEK